MKNKTGIFDIINILLLFILGVITIYPFTYTLSLSLSSASSAAKSGLHFFPKEFELTAYNMVLKSKDVYIGYANTLGRTIIGTTFTIFFTSFAAYPLSRSYMPHKRFYMVFILITMLFNGGLVPIYLNIDSLNLIDNRLVYVLPTLTSAWNIIIMRNFYMSIPESLVESAKIDGASEFKILYRIILPVSVPVIATIGLWTAVYHWNSWFFALLFMRTNSKKVLQIVLQRIVILNDVKMIEKGLVNPDEIDFTPETIKSATIIVTMLPILFVYPFLQKFFMKGIMLGAIKG